MSGAARIPKADITGLSGMLVKAGTRKMLGRTPDSIGVLWNHPAVFKDMMSLGRKSEKWDRLDPVLATYAAMATAATVGCSFCLDLHYFLTHYRGLDEAKAREVPRWRESSAFTPLERLVMEYAAAVSQTPPTVTDELATELLDELGAPALVELTARVAVMNSTARTNIALGIGSEGFSDACGLPPIATCPADVVSSA